MAIKISSNIVSVEVVKKDKKEESTTKTKNFNLIERDECLSGKTYKLRPANSDHSIYVTINNITLPDGSIRPYEIFINSKNPSNLQWIAAVTRLLSAMMRNLASSENYDISFLVDELVTVHDLSDVFWSGQFLEKPALVPSTISLIGNCIKSHLRNLESYKIEQPQDKESDFSGAEICPSCKEKRFMRSECICKSCGFSKC